MTNVNWPDNLEVVLNTLKGRPDKGVHVEEAMKTLPRVKTKIQHKRN